MISPRLRFKWIKIWIQNFSLLLGSKYKEIWRSILIKTPTGIIKEIAITVFEIQCQNPEQLKTFAPLHVAAYIGNEQVFRNVFENSMDKIPKDNTGKIF